MNLGLEPETSNPGLEPGIWDREPRTNKIEPQFEYKRNIHINKTNTNKQKTYTYININIHKDRDLDISQVLTKQKLTNVTNITAQQ